MSAIPSNWSQLRQAEKAKLDKSLGELKFEAELIPEILDREIPVLTRAFPGSAEYLARVFVIGGAELARSACYLADDALPRLLSHGDEPARRASAAAVGALSYVALMRCLDVKLPDAAKGVEARWLRVIAPKPDRLNDYNIRTAALAAVATGEVDLIPLLDGGGPLVPRTTSREIAGANVAGFTRHLAEVIKGGGGHAAVEAPWRSFLQMFPITVASKGVYWVDLVWVAMVMMVQFEKRPPSAVGTWLPKHVAELD
jgi:hypothetical protein